MNANPRSVARTLIVVLAVLCEIGIVGLALALHQYLLLAVLVVPPLLAVMAFVRSYRAKGAEGEDEAETENDLAEPLDDEPEPEALRFMSRPVPRVLGILLIFAIVLAFVILIRWAMQKYVG